MAFHSEVSARHVLVTGAAGFTGEYVCAALREAGYRVSGATGHNPVAPDRLLDITVPEQCRRVINELRPTHVVHLAAISFVGHEDPLAFYNVNVLGTLNLLQACADVGHVPDKVLLASSANIYGNAAGIVDENTPPAPVNHYATSKIAMEYMARTWFDRLPIIITRPFNYTGRGQSQRFLVPKIVSHFRQREPVIELGNLDVARDFSDVRTVAQVYRALLESGVSSDVVNVCNEQPITLREVLQRVQEASGHNIEVRVNPAFVRANEVKILAGSAAKLRRLLPQMEAIDFSDTIEWMVSA